MKHHPSCTANYPEKLSDETPQELTRVSIGEGDHILQCVDCGAYVVVGPDGGAPVKRWRYLVEVYRRRRLYDFQVHEVDGFDVSVYIQEMLQHGYGLNVWMEEA